MCNFSIIVTLRLKPGTGERLRPMILENANSAVANEAGCLQFNVMTDEDNPDVYHLVEIYENAAALDTHRQQPHYKKFFESAADLIEERTIMRCNVIKV